MMMVRVTQIPLMAMPAHPYINLVAEQLSMCSYLGNNHKAEKETPCSMSSPAPFSMPYIVPTELPRSSDAKDLQSTWIFIWRKQVS